MYEFCDWEWQSPPLVILAELKSTGLYVHNGKLERKEVCICPYLLSICVCHIFLDFGLNADHVECINPEWILFFPWCSWIEETALEFCSSSSIGRPYTS